MHLAERMPPFSAPSEQALIGAVFQRGDVAMDAARVAGITSESFHIMANQLVWEAIERVESRGRGMDVVMVQDQLKANGTFEAAGGGSYLDLCIESCHTPSQAKSYASVVKEKENRRKIIDSSRRAIDEAYSDDEGCEDRAMSEISNLSSEMAGLSGAGSSKVGDLIREMRDDWAQTRDHGFQGVPTGWGDLGGIIGGYRYGELSVVAGYRGEGKSLYMGNEALAGAKKGEHTLVVSLEMPKRRIAARIAGDVGDFSTFKMDMARGEEHDWSGLDDAEGKCDPLPLFIEDSKRDLSSVLRVCRHHVIKYGVTSIWIDYLQLMHIDGYSGNRNNEIGKITGGLTEFAKQYNVGLQVLSQFSRDPDKADRPPKLSDLRDSGCIEQDARLVILIYKDPDTEPDVQHLGGGVTRKDWRYIFQVAKHNSGPEGEVFMRRVSARQRWVEESQMAEFTIDVGSDPIVEEQPDISGLVSKAEMAAANKSRGLPE